MPSTLVPFTQEYLEPAVAVFLDSYTAEQHHSRVLPSRVRDDPTWIQGLLHANLANPGVVVVEQNHVLAYMVTGDHFVWKGQQAAIVLEYGHSAIGTQKRALYQRMYSYLAQQWVNQQIHLHLIRYFAHDLILQETLYHLGFGAILAERLRACSAVAARPEVAIRVEPDVSRLITLQTEHNRYYLNAPIFIRKPTAHQDVLAELAAHAAQGNVVFAYDDQQEPCAYMIVGEATIGGEGCLLQQTKTAQIKSAYVRPELRGQGIGTALLQRAVEWAHQQRYARVFVEHETANVYGGQFWGNYFTPYLYASMRYIDPTLSMQG